MHNERGIVLPLTLMMVMVLGSLTLGLLALSAIEPPISDNLADTSQARFAAEAGIEFAFEQLATTPDWDTLLVGADPVTGVALASSAPIGTLSAARGAYTVALRNDTRPADPQITGVAPAELSATDDENSTLIVTATGTKGNATRTLRVVAKRASLPPLPAALMLPGIEAEVYFSGNGFGIDGRGWKTDGTLDAGCAEKYGIAVSEDLPESNPGGNEGVVEAGLSSTQKDNVKGKKQNPGGAAEGNNTIAPDALLSPANVTAFIDAVKGQADVKLDSTQASPLSLTDVGASCASDPNSQTCWGTPTDPKVVWIKGEPDPSSNFAALTLNGDTEGYGILVVEDGDFRISGDFLWHGLIIVTGQWVGIGYLGGGQQTVYGAVISNETATDPGYREGVMTGNSQIRYSCEALDLAFGVRKLVSLWGWKELAPGE